MNWILAAAVAFSGCGYHVAGRADLMPKTIKTVAIPAFGNVTPRYKLSSRLPAALTREFISRTRYEVIADPNEADAVLTGTVSNFYSYPTVFDQSTGRASGVQLTVLLSLTLTERATGKILYNRPNFEARERYEISVDPLAWFDESEPALERVSREVARQVVSSILENF